MNTREVLPHAYQHILEQFPEAYHEKLAVYTGEELFYAYKLILFSPKKDRNGDIKPSDVFYLALKAKLIRWLQGKEAYPIAPMAWGKIGAKFRAEYYAFLEQSECDDLTG